jgi:site-specific DNA-adenine methylase
VIKAPFPYFGGKSRAAHFVWERFGEVKNYVEPFFGSGAVLLSRPDEPHTETVNDLDCMLANFWRALQHDPEAVALSMRIGRSMKPTCRRGTCGSRSKKSSASA